MLIKYGKAIDMRKINRNLAVIKENIENSKENSERFYCASNSPFLPKCRICGGEKTKLFVQMYEKYEYTYDFYECNECGALFLKNLPNIKEMYCDSNKSANGEFYIDDTVYKQRMEMISAPKIQFVMDACRNMNLSINSWLDIGCGGGEILSWLRENSDIQAEGIEADTREYNFAISKGLSVSNFFIDLKNNNSQIGNIIQRNDVISFFNVLEHIQEPQKFIDYMYNHMYCGAIMVFEVPRHPSVASFANLTCRNATYRHIIPPIHLQIFSEKSIQYMLRDKFEVIGQWVFGQGYSDLINNAMLSVDEEENELYSSLISLSNKIQPIFDEEGFGDSIIVVAVKK